MSRLSIHEQIRIYFKRNLTLSLLNLIPQSMINLYLSKCQQPFEFTSSEMPYMDFQSPFIIPFNNGLLVFFLYFIFSIIGICPSQ
jgi:hypothetical protein